MSLLRWKKMSNGWIYNCKFDRKKEIFYHFVNNFFGMIDDLVRFQCKCKLICRPVDLLTTWIHEFPNIKTFLPKNSQETPIKRLTEKLWLMFISYLKCYNLHRISKLAYHFGCLFTFCYSARVDLLKTKLQTRNSQTGQSISY